MDRADKRQALALLARGEATPSEVAELAGVSRQLLHAWCASAGIDWRAKRGTRLMEQWAKAARVPAPKVSKARLHGRADEAKAEWDLRHEQPGLDQGTRE